MKKINNMLLSACMLIIMFSLIATVDVNAVGPPDQTVEVSGDSIQTELQSNIITMFQFRAMTQLTFSSNVQMDLILNCDTNNIKNKEFSIEIQSENILSMCMTCTREEHQLGLMDGKTYRIRNRYTYRYKEGFCVSIECIPRCDCECQCEGDCQCICNCDCQCQNECQCDCDCECQCLYECQCMCDCECQCQNECQCICNCDDKETCIQARLRIRLTKENRFGKWAYYDENVEEWVTVPTSIGDGYLIADTNHFSTWTILIPTFFMDNSALILGSSSVIAIFVILIGISSIYAKRRN
ncbi:MAG: hypothetical protein ACFFEY_17965 [Candidatus Thorarchaeota archaeon]